jgi:hypothetical protein
MKLSVRKPVNKFPTFKETIALNLISARLGQSFPKPNMMPLQPAMIFSSNP